MKSQAFKAIHELGGECPEVVYERFEFMGIGRRIFLPPSFCLTGLYNSNGAQKHNAVCNRGLLSILSPLTPMRAADTLPKKMTHRTCHGLRMVSILVIGWVAPA